MEPEVTYAELWLPDQVKRGPKAVIKTTVSTPGKSLAAFSPRSKYLTILGLFSLLLLVITAVLLAQVLLLSRQLQEKAVEVKQYSESTSYLSDSLQQILNDSTIVHQNLSQLSMEYQHLAIAYQQQNETLKVILKENKHLTEHYEYSRKVHMTEQLFDCRMEDMTPEKDVSCQACPVGWIFESQRCYYFSLERKNWQDSQNFCVLHLSNLVTIHSQKEQVFITDMVYKTKEVHWLGYSDTERESDWLWVDGSHRQKKFWAHGQPDNWNNNENCATMSKNPGPQREINWNDENCLNMNRYICGKEVDTVTLKDPANFL